MVERFPLHWPVGYKRNKTPIRSRFQVSADKAQQNLRNQLNLIGAINIIVSSNVYVKKDGFLYADMLSTTIDDPGIAVYFKYKGKDVVMCCDKYHRPFENIHALGLAIEGLRTIERHDVSEFLERAFTGFKALPEQANAQAWHQVLGVPPNADKDAIKDAYRKMAQIHHPDSGGSAEMFAKVNQAYQQGMATV